MKRNITIILIIAFTVLAVDLGIMGVKIFDNDYNILVEGYIGLSCFLIIFVCGIISFFAELRKRIEGKEKFQKH